MDAPIVKLSWAKPMCPVIGTYNRNGRESGATCYDFSRMELEFARAKLLPDAPRPEDLLGERQERVAAMAYQIHGIDEVRDYLVDHHRPRVANMARKHRVP